MQVIIDGAKIRTEADLHATLAKQLDFGTYYGNNLAALWDRLTTDVERPVEIIWSDSDQSRIALGEELFGRIARVLMEVEEQDRSFGRDHRLTITLA